MEQNKDVIDTVLITLGGTAALANIEYVLGILILVIQIIWILFKFGFKLYTLIKNKKSIEDVDDVFEETIDGLGSVTSRKTEVLEDYGNDEPEK